MTILGGLFQLDATVNHIDFLYNKLYLRETKQKNGLSNAQTVHLNLHLTKNQQH